MYRLARFWHSTIGKKVVMAVTGIVGILFVVAHMSGNLLMFQGQDAMHHYALLLRTSMPALYVARAVLLASVVLHALAAYQLTMRARAARPDGYAARKTEVTTVAAKAMRWGGVVLLGFLVYHILHMTLGTVHPQFTHLDPYSNLRIGLSNPFVAAFYGVAMVLLGLHLYHGTWASLRTLGLSPASAHPLKRRLALVLAVVVAAGFMTVPIATLLGLFPDMPPLQAPLTTTTAPSPHRTVPAPVATVGER